MIFLYMSLLVAQKFGIAFSGQVTGWAQKKVKGLAQAGWTATTIPGTYKAVRDDWGKNGVPLPGVARTKDALERSSSPFLHGIASTLPASGRTTPLGESGQKTAESVASFLGARPSLSQINKDKNERINDAADKIKNGAEHLEAASMLVAAERGYTKGNSGNDLWNNDRMERFLNNNSGIREQVFESLKKAGQGQFQMQAKIMEEAMTLKDSELSSGGKTELRQGKAVTNEQDKAAIRGLLEAQVKNISIKDLVGKQDLKAIDDLEKKLVGGDIDKQNSVVARRMDELIQHRGRANAVASNMSGSTEIYLKTILTDDKYNRMMGSSRNRSSGEGSQESTVDSDQSTATPKTTGSPRRRNLSPGGGAVGVNRRSNQR
jgi:hypothetical protein